MRPARQLKDCVCFLDVGRLNRFCPISPKPNSPNPDPDPIPNPIPKAKHTVTLKLTV